MEYTVDGKVFTFSNDIRSDSKRRLSFDALAQKTFRLSFENWYNAGFWTEKHQPYTLSEGYSVAASISVNIIDTAWQGVSKRYIQLGTVMTDTQYRNMGLSKYLMNRILDDWLDRCDAMYLFANDSVLAFYPRFGFVKAEEYQASLPVTQKCGMVRKLDMSCQLDVDRLHAYYRKSNPFSEFPMIDNWELLMFYCSDFMKDCVYYVEDYQAIMIAEERQDILTVYDIYCNDNIPLTEAICILANEGCRQIRLGFALKDPQESSLSLQQERNSTLFLLAAKENVFKHHKTMFPLLSHA